MLAPASGGFCFFMKNIRNFCIIAHIDHGKSTLADRFLEITGTVKKEKMREQILDQMDLERERGITIKMQPCAMNYSVAGRDYELNLIDTPGHMDFSYEVERSLSAVESVVLLVDAVSGVQAQTLANLRLARAQGLTIIPVINKIDICPSKEQLEKVKQEIAAVLGKDCDAILCISAKTGENVEKALEAIIKQAPSPSFEGGGLKALVFDSVYDNFQGVIAYVRMFEGEVKKGDQIYFVNQKASAEAREVGVFRPGRSPAPKLLAGQIGYIATGIKNVSDVKIGDTIAANGQPMSESLPGYREPKPLVFANIFPGQDQNFEILKSNFDKLQLNDTALTAKSMSNAYLGRGLRIGFLGMLHMEIFMERLKREYGTQVVLTSPSVVFKAKLKNQKEPITVHSAAELPDQGEVEYIEEPWVKLNVISPTKYSSKIHELVEQKRGKFIASQILDKDTLLLEFQAPLCEIIEEFLDKVKSVSKGFASFSYEFDEYKKSEMVKLKFLISHELKPCFSKIVHKDKAIIEARQFVKRLKDVLPSKNFTQSLQAQVNGKIIAREDIRAMRKDVTAPLYGGDITRKKKLLVKQRKGKKLLQKHGRTPIPEQVYLKLLRK